MAFLFEYAGDTYLLHHDIEVLPSGNILAIAWEMKDYDACVAAGRDPSYLANNELWPDSVIEIEPSGTSGGTIVWEWHVWDHLIQDYDATKSNFGVVEDDPGKIDINYLGNGSSGGDDWTHFNGVDYNADYDQILVSVHGLNEIWIIDHSTTTARPPPPLGAPTARAGTCFTGGEIRPRTARGIQTTRCCFPSMTPPGSMTGIPAQATSWCSTTAKTGPTATIPRWTRSNRP